MNGMCALVAVGATTCLLSAACGSSPGNAAAPAVSSTPDRSVVCASFGGCDVRVDLDDGTESIIALKTSSFAQALSRAQKEAQRTDVFAAVVVGHDAPHVVLSQDYYD